MDQSPLIVQTKMLDYFFALLNATIPFQPIVDLHTWEAWEYECLTRPGVMRPQVSVGEIVDAAVATGRTVEFDLSTPEGRAAFEEFERTGELPPPGPGITKWKDVQVDGVTGEYEGEVSIGKEKLKLFGDDWESTRTTTTSADGSKHVEDRIRNDSDNATIVIERTFNPDGTEDVSKRRVRQELKVTPENEKQLEAMLTAAYGVPYDLQPGQTVSIVQLRNESDAELEGVFRMAAQADGPDSMTTRRSTP